MNGALVSCFLLSALLCIGCSSIPHRTIIIKDGRGSPISMANVSPYPILIRNIPSGSSGNEADSQGRIVLYDVQPGGDYTLRAPGFLPRSISFPRRDNVIFFLKPAS